MTRALTSLRIDASLLLLYHITGLLFEIREIAMNELQERKNQAIGVEVPDTWMVKDTHDEKDRVKMVPAPRITEADEKNDRK